MGEQELFERARELDGAARRMAEATAGAIKPSSLPAVVEEVENALRYLALSFGRLASEAEERPLSNELFALSELCRAAYRQAWAARHSISQLAGEPD